MTRKQAIPYGNRTTVRSKMPSKKWGAGPSRKIWWKTAYREAREAVVAANREWRKDAALDELFYAQGNPSQRRR